MDDTTDRDPKEAARESFHGKRLTDAQLDKAMDYASILRRHIDEKASFVEPLQDVAHSFARSERFNAQQGEDILRSVYERVYGETLNQTREKFLGREDEIHSEENPRALEHARKIEVTIKTEKTTPFYIAHDREGVALAKDLGITERRAKEMMATAFEKEEGVALYDHGKAIEEQHYQPERSKSRREIAPERSEGPPRRQSRRR